MFLTHFHADFIAGHLELRDRAGATIYLAARRAGGVCRHPARRWRGDRDGPRPAGGARTRPATRRSRCRSSSTICDVSADVPHAVLTGDTLFVGDVGRPDLRAALGWSAAQLGDLLYDSLHGKLLPLPDATLVYPAHGAGSLCGKAISKETVSTIGEQRRSNYAVQPMSKSAFVDLVTADQPDAPAYFTYDAVLNSRERPTLDRRAVARAQAAAARAVLSCRRRGAQLLDTRDPIEFAAAHLRGSINIGLVGQYATWAGTVLSRDQPIVIVADPGRRGRVSAAPRPHRLRSRGRLSRRRTAQRRTAGPT